MLQVWSYGLISQLPPQYYTYTSVLIEKWKIIMKSKLVLNYSPQPQLLP